MIQQQFQKLELQVKVFQINSAQQFSQINSAQQINAGGNNGCMCLATQTEKIGTSQGSTGGSSVLQGIKKTASNIWSGIKNILGRIF